MGNGCLDAGEKKGDEESHPYEEENAMKSHSKSLVMLGLLAFGAAQALAVDVTVDPAKTWYGYMNVFDAPVGSGAYQFGSPWGTPDLPATFSGSTLRLAPNTNVYNPADPYWTNPDGSGAKWMNANMYVEDPSLVGSSIHFQGQTVLNTFANGYSSKAFIKVLDPALGYATIAEVYAPLVNGQPFTLDLAVPNTPGLLPQYGFVTDGLDANPATVGSLGFVLIAPIPEPATIALGLGFVALLRRR